MTAVFTSIKISNSYAIFTDTIKGEKTITLTLDKNLDKSGANRPVLSDAMIPVYYDSQDKIWRKADRNNEEKEHKWYDYDRKMWANSVTYDHTKLANESKTKIEGKTFNGTSDYINMGYANENFGKTVTLVARFKVKELNTNGQSIISNAQTAGIELSISGNISDDIGEQKLFFNIYGNNQKDYLNLRSNETIEKDKWYTVVGTYDGATMKLYINGKLEATKAVTDTIKQSTMPFTIGANPEPDNRYIAYFKGTISDAIVIKDAIDEDTIKKNYSGEVTNKDNPNQLFYSKFDNKIGNINEAKYTKEGMTFDGDNDYVDIGLSNYDFKNTITLAARFKTSVSSNTDDQYIIANVESAGINIRLSQNNYIWFSVYSKEKNDYIHLNSGIQVEQNKWYTVVATYDGTLENKNMKLYVNGVLGETYDVTGNIKLSTMPITIGINPQPDNKNIQYFNGTISDALVINKTLSENEAINLSNNNNFKDYANNENTLIYNNLKSYESRENGTEVPMDMISTMQVWIPRYKYKVWNYNENGDKISDPKEIEITFEEGTNKTGDITCEDNIQGEGGDGTSETCTLKTTKEECTDAICNNKTYTHPGFTFGEDELTGFWVGKFELSSDIVCTPKDSATLGQNCNLKTIEPNVKPNLYSWRGAQISTFETAALSMNDDNNKYGFNTNDDTHIIKNSEWGAIAYLSHSKYGKNGEVEMNTNNLYITGCGPISKGNTEASSGCSTYETELGQSASTTGNIYGVYDMSGGTWEFSLSNMVSKDGKTMISGKDLTTQNSGYTGIVYDNGNFSQFSGINYPEDKYYEKYSFGITNNDNLARRRSKLADAVKEIYSWYKDYSVTNHVQSSFNVRGGADYNKNDSGIFSVGPNNGSVNSNVTSRLIISNSK